MELNHTYITQADKLTFYYLSLMLHFKVIIIIMGDYSSFD